MPKPSENAVKGRANLARPLLWLLAVLTALLVPAIGATAARAEQLETLLLTKTSPASSEAEPASSTTPLVFGAEEGVIITVVQFGPLRSSPGIAAASDPSNEVAIYANSSCEGKPLNTGTLGELEKTGVQVAVAENIKTTLYAIQSDPDEINETSECPTFGLGYWQGSKPVTPPTEPPPSGRPAERPASGNPPVAPRLRTVPSGRANDNSPRIVGSAPGAERVKIFASASCSGSPVATVSAGELAAGVLMHVPDNSVTDFAGVSVAGGKQSFCSPPATYIEDSTPPRVRITMAPGTKTRHHKAVFRFADTSEEPDGTTFICRVNHRKWKPCHSPFKLRHLGFRHYVLRVSGMDATGNVAIKPAKRSFKVIH
jgi:hypothetical protein